MATGTGAGTKTTSYAYDWLNRLSTVTNEAQQQVSYEYDDAGNLTRITYPAASNLYVVRVPDAANRVESLELHRLNDTQIGSFGFAYYDNGAIHTQAYENGAVALFNYDGAGRIVGTNYTFPHGHTRNFGYEWKPNGNLSVADDLNPDGTTTHHAYGYTDAQRVWFDDACITTNGQCPEVEHRNWEYDEAGNLRYARVQPHFSPVPDSTSTWEYGNRNELKTLTQITNNVTRVYSYGFDLTGNRKDVYPDDKQNYHLFNYNYDQENRLTTISGADYPGTAQYSYDGDGLRVQKALQTPPDPERCPATGCNSSVNFDLQATGYTWDVEAGIPLLLQEQQTTNGQSTQLTSYIYGPRGVLAQIAPDGTLYYYHADQLGSIRLLSDSAGYVAADYTYDPYGQRLTRKDGPANPFGFAGEYLDDESGLIYLRARYYDPATQQFLTRDTADTVHPYTYGNGNPLNASDPTGHEPDDPARNEQWVQGELPLSESSIGIRAVSLEAATSYAELRAAEERILEIQNDIDLPKKKTAAMNLSGTIKVHSWRKDVDWERFGFKTAPLQAMELQLYLQERTAFKYKDGYEKHAEPQLVVLMDSIEPIVVANNICSQCRSFFENLSTAMSRTWIVADTEGIWRFEPGANGKIQPWDTPLK